MVNKLIEEFKLDLQSGPLSFVCSKWILDRTPFIFNDDRITFIKWKENLAELLQVDSKALIITGSAGCGFSLSPYKNYRPFHANSDIDIALVSQLHFDIAWRTLRTLGTRRFNLSAVQKSSLKEHVERYIYWGTIATDKLLTLMPFGFDWSQHLISVSPKKPTFNRVINVRIYKDFDSLRAYQVNNLETLNLKMFEK